MSVTKWRGLSIDQRCKAEMGYTSYLLLTCVTIGISFIYWLLIFLLLYFHRGTRFFRIIPGFIIQGGDVTHDDGSGGECIWVKEQGGWFNRFFPDESFEIGHTCCGLLSMANEGPNTNQSQFFITCAPCPWLDCRNVVFGRVSVRSDQFLSVNSNNHYQHVFQHTGSCIVPSRGW